MNQIVKCLEITTKVPCDVQCSYCPQKVLNEAYKGIPELSFLRFKKFLTKIPKDVYLHFSGFSDLTCNPDSGKMIKYALSEGYHVSIFTTLMGAFYSSQILDRNLTQCVIHVPSSEILKGKEDIWISRFQQAKAVKITRIVAFESSYSNLIMSEIKNYDKVKICSRAGNLYSIPKQKDKIECKCGHLFHNVMLPNGDVVLCCMDYGLKHKLGNLNIQSYELILKNLINVEVALKTEAMRSICRNCENAVRIN